MSLGRDLCGVWESAARYEWLVTNGIGGYACGSVSLANTRRYHGLLVASLRPPVERILLASKVDVSVGYRGRETDLSTNEFADGTVSGHGYRYLESFAIADGVPVWRYAVDDALIEQRIFMAPGRNVCYLRLQALRASEPCKVRLKPFVVHRDHHAHSRGAHPYQVTVEGSRCRIAAPGGATAIDLAVAGAEVSGAPEWYWGFLHRMEAERGLDAIEDLLLPAIFHVELTPGTPITLIASAGPQEPPPAEEALQMLADRSARLVQPLPGTAPAWVRALARAGDQFIVRRRGTGARGAADPSAAVVPPGAPAPSSAAVPSSAGVPSSASAPSSAAAQAGAAAARAGAGAQPGVAPHAGDDGFTIIAGYPWFTDWGRDAMIALPGLATALRRFDVAASVLRQFAAHVDGGMIPNFFPDGGQAPEYNTADATLWLFEALEDYLQANADPALVRELYPTLARIIRAHIEGTRHGIRVDPADGLLHAGERGTQLTWMDARHGEEVFTPRVGKPVEINALWLNALEITGRLAARQRDADTRRLCAMWLERGRAGFQRFWNPDRGCLFDVLDQDGPAAGATARADARMRPNQILALSLRHCALDSAQARAVVTKAAAELLTSYGLRSLGALESGYIGHYGGDPRQRDAAYHMGTVWSWLLGPFARAHYRAFGDARRAQSFLFPIAQHLDAACLGTVSEIFDGDAPHHARGCFAQAWSVAEILRAWVQLERLISRTRYVK